MEPDTSSAETTRGQRRLFARQVASALAEIAPSLPLTQHNIASDAALALGQILDEVSTLMAENDRLRVAVATATERLEAQFGHADAPYDPVALEALAALRAAGVSPHTM